MEEEPPENSSIGGSSTNTNRPQLLAAADALQRRNDHSPSARPLPLLLLLPSVAVMRFKA